MATESVATTPTAPSDVGLKREMGLIGATWASETSIIGSGWLFGALFASQAAGPIALLGWVIGGVAVIFLALVHAELGGMYPVSGGTARFPHLAYGSVAGISFGFFSWVQAITVAPIECFAVMQYGSYYWHGLFDVNANGGKGNVTGLGFAMTVVLMVIFTALNFLAMRTFSKVNAGITWWKVAIPVLTIIVLLFKFHGGNFTSHGGFNPYGWKALFAAIPSAGIVFAYLGFEQADQLAAEIKNPQKNLPRAILLATFIGIIIYVMLQVVFIGAMPSSQLAHGWAKISDPDILAGPFAGLAGHRRPRLAGRCPADRRVRLPVRHRPHLPDLKFAGWLRPGPQPLLPAVLHQGRRERHPVDQPARRVRGRAALPAAVPELALAGGPGHRGQRADVRGRPAVYGRVPPAGPRGQPALPGARG